ncbi:conserved hypothetical protein [Leishmania major strain Friedlin]|uniref:Uncharacterized protein n=1 Tax=Leishmania major TaxID=5664 RepID=Q4QAH2_LEIMA|nr:conserved hypothetical protein [Leishmania major strain Friedlin]CAG9574632.1 hypothetical_protein_-_conserved [Leishmania major strain Friedlin]CAJ05141.1 conserved hypothetical protein [Leishmania major strain Friedlin]|eukprot:XP_001683676.1 conserved hypothetical protein [Leishmania major strain Friedlin]
MDAAIAQLRGCLEELLTYYPHVLRNVFEVEPSPLAAPKLSQQRPRDSSALADVIEDFLTELTRVLSIGLCDDDLGLWSVLELLECVPARMQAVAEATATAPETAALSKHGAQEPLQQLQRFRFASQLVYLVRSAFPATAPAVRARIFLRLTLNQGCLVAALELLREWCRSELLVFYAASDRGRRNGAAGSASSVALLVQSDTDSDMWNSFVAAIAPVAGPPVAEIAAGAPKVAAQPFHLQLLVPGLDDNSAASHAYYTQVENYACGRQPTRPSALACYRAALRQHSGSARKHDRSFRAASAGEGAASSPKLSPHPAEQLVLRVESLSVDHRTASGKEVAPVSRGNVSYDSSSTLSSRPMTLEPLSFVHRERLRGAKKRRRRHPSLSTAGAVAREEDAAGSPTPEGKTDNTTSDNTGSVAEAALHTSTVVTEAKECQGAPEAGEKAAPPYRDDYASRDDDPQVAPTVGETGAAQAASRALDTVSTDSPASAPHCLSPALRAAESPNRTLDSSSAPALSPELRNLQHRLWLCWLAVVTHAESEERIRITVRDVDANIS